MMFFTAVFFNRQPTVIAASLSVSTAYELERSPSCGTFQSNSNLWCSCRHKAKSFAAMRRHYTTKQTHIPHFNSCFPGNLAQPAVQLMTFHVVFDIIPQSNPQRFHLPLHHTILHSISIILKLNTSKPSQYALLNNSANCFQSLHCLKKVCPLMFDNNFGKCGPIFTILSPIDL